MGMNYDYEVALTGNPNTGKSTIFNTLTGLNQHTGNWPGKSVVRAEGRHQSKEKVLKLVDLPGTYSLLANSIEEQVSRDYLCFSRPDCTVVVADATCLERNLNLALQVLEITPRVVLCVNMIDEAKRKRIHIDTDSLSLELGVPVVATIARAGYGMDKLVLSVLEVASGLKTPVPCTVKYDKNLEEAISKIEPKLIELLGEEFNTRWLSLRLLDRDRTVTEAIKQWLSVKGGGEKGRVSSLVGGEVMV
ncbi:MAG: FeoB small GTPase domain-containing protein [Bacillota bacterium]